jgi:hypothetical protein
MLDTPLEVAVGLLLVAIIVISTIKFVSWYYSPLRAALTIFEIEDEKDISEK